jgi:hypothetical protein
MLKINDAYSCKGEETDKRQYLVAPLHSLSCSGGL